MIFQNLFRVSFWQEWLKTDFNRGCACGAGCVIGLLLVYFVLKIIFFLAFRRHRCGAIEFHHEEGVVQIDRDAVEFMIRELLKKYPELTVDSVKLYLKGKVYQLRMFCSLSNEGRSLPELLDVLKPEIRQKLQELFGITNLHEIDVRVEELTAGAPSQPSGDNDAVPAAAETAAVPYGSGPLL